VSENHPLWGLFRTLYQISTPPFLLGAMAQAAGYTWSLVQREERPVSPDFVAFTRDEQIRRLRYFPRGVLTNRRNSS
jgi:hypothetical protein